VGRLDQLDLSLDLGKKEYKRRLKDAQKRLAELRLHLGGKLGDGELGPPLCVLFEGWDASGKGGAIERLIDPLDMRHVRVAQFSAPSSDAERHHFMWRFWPVLPGWGGMTVLDRSWYGRVLVERVEGLASPEEWQRAYDEIVQFERSQCSEGMVLVKFWMHISEDEQMRRFERRQHKDLKRWKLTEEDWRNRDKYPEYLEAVEDMLARTDEPLAPWTLIEGDSKRWARVAVIEAVIERIEKAMREWDIEPPPPLDEDSD
jgi:polyphosphate kinase 2 (PPK2 family)